MKRRTQKYQHRKANRNVLRPTCGTDDGSRLFFEFRRKTVRIISIEWIISAYVLPESDHPLSPFRFFKKTMVENISLSGCVSWIVRPPGCCQFPLNENSFSYISFVWPCIVFFLMILHIRANKACQTNPYRMPNNLEFWTISSFAHSAGKGNLRPVQWASNQAHRTGRKTL